MSSLRLYSRYISICIQSQLQYRASFVMLTVANCFTSFVEFFGTIALFQRFSSLKGWSLPEVALFYGMVHTAFATSETIGRGFDIFHLHVKSGTFDRMLLRPRSTVLQVLGQEFQMLRFGRFVQGTAVLLWGASQLGVEWTLPKIVLVLLSVLGGTLLFVGILVLQATMSFWSVDSLEIANSLTFGGVETAQFPLSVYRSGLREFFIFIVPLASINYFPALAVIGKPDPLGYPALLSWMSPAIGALFFLATLGVWGIGVKHYHSTGS